jgi:hypothetical protein
MNKPFDIELFLTGVISGSTATRRRHLRQAKKIQAAIFERWQRDNPWTWQRKHLEWFLNHHMQRYSEATLYYYRLTLKMIILRLEKSWRLI